MINGMMIKAYENKWNAHIKLKNIYFLKLQKLLKKSRYKEIIITFDHFNFKGFIRLKICSCQFLVNFCPL